MDSQLQGEVLFFVDADGIFEPGTLREMLFGFTSAKWGAVCVMTLR